MAVKRLDCTPDTGEWLTGSRFAALLALALIISFPDVLFGGRTFFFRDYATFGYPLASYHRESFWMGEIPLWNPLNHLGLPFLAQWNTLVLYPPALTYLLLPLPFSLDLFCLLHLFCGGVGMYFLAKTWTKSSFAGSVAGFGFAFSGLALSCLKWPNNIAALGLLPWIVLLWEKSWTGDRRVICGAVLLGALQMLSGAPEIILFTWVFLFSFSCGKAITDRKLRWQILRRGAFCVAIIAALSAAQLLPFFELLSHSQRNSEFDGAGWAMPVWGWLNLFVPLFRAFPSHQGVFAQFDQYWISSYYPGIVILTCALIAVRSYHKKACLLAATILVSLMLALGSAGMVYDWVGKILPISSFMRFPVKFVVLAGFCFPLLAAFGVHYFVTKPGQPARRELLVSVAVVVVILGIIALAKMKPLAGIPISSGEQAAIALRSGLSRIGFLVAAIGLTLVLRRDLPFRTRVLVQCAFLGVILFDAITHSPRLNPTVENWVYRPVPPAMGILDFDPRPAIRKSRALVTAEAHDRLSHRTFPEASRDVMYSRGALLANCNLLEGIPKTDGFYSLNFPAEQRIQQLLASSNRAAYPGLLDFLSVSHRTVPVTSTDKVLEWESRPTHLPWVTIGQTVVFADSTQTFAGLADPAFDPRATVFLQPQPGKSSVPQQKSASANVQKFEAHQINVSVETPASTVLVISQTHYPPWKAYIDGIETPIFVANLAFQAVEVPQGKHDVSFVYDDRAFKVGALVSILTLLGVAFTLLSGFRRGAARADMI